MFYRWWQDDALYQTVSGFRIRKNEIDDHMLLLFIYSTRPSMSRLHVNMNENTWTSKHFWSFKQALTPSP